ncbi:MAG: hypothetical protein QXS19_07615 [Candidatus Methanomethylicia archaeon]
MAEESMIFTKDIIDSLNREYGEGNWKIRQVSKNIRHNNLPSLTLTRELSAIGIKPKDFVLVAVKDRMVIVKRI